TSRRGGIPPGWPATCARGGSLSPPTRRRPSSSSPPGKFRLSRGTGGAFVTLARTGAQVSGSARGWERGSTRRAGRRRAGEGGGGRGKRGRWRTRFRPAIRPHYPPVDDQPTVSRLMDIELSLHLLCTVAPGQAATGVPALLDGYRALWDAVDEVPADAQV